jgi:hypothetical protein
VGIDLSPAMIARAQDRHPELEFHVGNAEDPADLARIAGVFDIVLLSDTIGFLDDCEAALRALQRFATPSTRIIVSYHSRLWEPVLRAAAALGLKMPQGQHTWLSTADAMNLLALAGWEPMKREWRQLLPRRIWGLGRLINSYIAPIPGIRRLCLRSYVVARPIPAGAKTPSCTVVIPCRNEKGNIEDAVRRLPSFAADMEIIFVEGHSTDGTYERCLEVRDAFPHLDIKVLQQDGKGKGDAVRKGFAAARGEILMILDADLTVPPESLSKFYHALCTGKAEFVNGSRLVYPVAEGAMRALNRAANRIFADLFSFILNQRLTDTLCGTKALWKRDYERIASTRAYFGQLDPFGDFDLIFGAARLNLKITEIPVRYADRSYGQSNISRFRDGWLLAKMVLVAWHKFKAV